MEDPTLRELVEACESLTGYLLKAYALRHDLDLVQWVEYAEERYLARCLLALEQANTQLQFQSQQVTFEEVA